MIHDKFERSLDHLDRRVGSLAFPQILRWIAGLQLLNWFLLFLSPEFSGWIGYDRDAILSGQVWRLLTWVLTPIVGVGGGFSLVWILIATLFMFFINDHLEGHWGSFRLNVYVFSSVILLSLLGLLPFADGAGFLWKTVFFSTVFLAFAALFPNQVIHLFLIIPVKAKWLGWFNAAMLVLTVFSFRPVLLAGILVVAGMAPFLAVFLPGWIRDYRQSGKAAARRQRFQAQSLDEDEAFHRCEICGATDESHPDKEFRVTADGDEICSECREEASQ